MENITQAQFNEFFNDMLECINSASNAIEETGDPCSASAPIGSGCEMVSEEQADAFREAVDNLIDVCFGAGKYW